MYILLYVNSIRWKRSAALSFGGLLLIEKSVCRVG